MILQNHGEEISLRLRTDDLKGFRKYESIKKTLLHELVRLNWVPNIDGLPLNFIFFEFCLLGERWLGGCETVFALPSIAPSFHILLDMLTEGCLFVIL